MEKKFDVKKFLSNNAIIILIALLALFVGSTTQNFFTVTNGKNLLLNVAPRFIIACGVSGCLITKGTDLSAGRQVGLAACFSAMLILAIFPGIAYWAANLLGFMSPINFVYVVIIFLLLAKQFFMSIRLSQLDSKVRILTEQVALNEEKVEREKLDL